MHHTPAAEISMEHRWLKPLVEFGSKREKKSCAPPTDEPMSPFLIFLLLTPEGIQLCAARHCKGQCCFPAN